MTTDASRPPGPQPRRQLPKQVPRDASFGIADCHRLLMREFGDAAPSIATLHRHAKAGQLKAMETKPSNKPPRYIWSRIRSHYQPRAVAPAALPEPGHAPAGVGFSQEQLAGALAAALGPLMQPVLEELASVRKEVAGLAAVRQTLMLKYDAAAGAALNRAELLNEQLRATRQLLDLDGKMTKLTAELARLASRVESRVDSDVTAK